VSLDKANSQNGVEPVNKIKNIKKGISRCIVQLMRFGNYFKIEKNDNKKSVKITYIIFSKIKYVELGANSMAFKNS